MQDKKDKQLNNKPALLTLIGAAIMTLMTATKVVPGSEIAGFSVFVGIAFFFIVEAAAKTPRSESGLRFGTVLSDLRRPGVLAWALLPVVSGPASCAIGNLLFGAEFSGHLMGRTAEILSFSQAPLLVVQVVVAAFGEEIAYRGFFLGKCAKIEPFWACAAISSAVFAAGHIAAGPAAVVLFDVACVFVDSLIFSIIYRKSGNCVVTTISHILGNAASIIVMMLLF